MKKITGFLMSVVLSGCAFWCLGADSRFLEAENFDALPQTGTFQNLPGWYAQRHEHASGGSFAVCHYPGASMSAMFETLPAGEYDVFLRVCRNRSANTSNLLTVELGNAKEGKFTPSASSDLILNMPGSGYGWEKVPLKFKMDSAFGAVRIHSGKVEGMGIGDDPEFHLPCVIVDSLVITNAQTEISGKDDRRKRTQLVFMNQQDDPRREVRPLPYPQIINPAIVSNLPSRDLFVSGRNLLRNSGFELSLKGNFSSYNPRLTGFNLDSDCLCKERPFEGRYCVRLRGKNVNPLSDYAGSPVRPIYGNGFMLSSFDRFLSRAIKEKVPGPMVFSVHARTNGRALVLNLAGKNIPVNHTDWRRYSVSFDSRKFSQNAVSFQSDDPEAELFLDAMQLERGTVPGKYMPLEGLEAGFQTHERANLFYRDAKGIPMELSVSSASGTDAEELSVSYRILDYSLRICAKGKFSIVSEPGKTVSREVRIPFSRLGPYLFVYEVEKHPQLSWAFPLSIIEKPLAPLARLGIIGSSNTEAMEIARHAGIGRMFSLNDNMLYFNIFWPSEKEGLRIYDKYIKLWQEKYGIDYVFFRPPFGPPAWTPNTLGNGSAAHMGRPNIDYAHWAEMWETVTKKLRGVVRFWMPADEMSYHRAPAEAAEYIAIATGKIRKNAPGSMVVNSTQAISLREMLRLRPGLDIGDAIGGSRHGLERNLFFYDLRNKTDMDRQFWVIGVGWSAPDWPEWLDFETFRPLSGKDTTWSRGIRSVSDVIPDLFEEMAVIGVEQYCLYTAKFDAGNDAFSTFSPMNVFRPFAVQYINGVNFLKDARRGGLILLDRADGISASYVLRNGKVCAMIRSLGRFEKTEVRIDLTSRGVRLYDQFLNPAELSDKFILLPGEAVFIEDDAIGGDQLLDAVCRSRARGMHDERRAIVNAPDGGLDLLILKNGKQAERRPFPAEAGIRYPLDQSRYNRVSNWGVVGRRSVPEIRLDGRLEEPVWRRAAPSFIYSIPYLNGSYGAMQGIEGFSSIEKVEELSATFRAAWDENALYLGIVAEGSFGKGSELRVKLDADLLGDIDRDDYDGDDYLLEIPLDGKSGTVNVDIKNFDGRKRGQAQAALSPEIGGCTVELKIPFGQLGLNPGKMTMGLSIEISDVRSGKTRTLSWTTNYAARKSPVGFGQLILSE